MSTNTAPLRVFISHSSVDAWVAEQLQKEISLSPPFDSSVGKGVDVETYTLARRQLFGATANDEQ